MNNQVMEREANRFALELLVPTDWLLSDIEELDAVDVQDTKMVAQLARKYKVTEAIMTVRIYQVLNESS